MANLPELPTGDISWVAFYNIVSQGGLGTDFDITDILDSGNVTSNTLYDNGCQGVYNGSNPQEINFRGKQDGWIIAWYDRTENDTNGAQGSKPATKLDFIPDWDSPAADPPGGVGNNTLEQAIDDLQSQMTDSQNISYSASDVGYYNYQFPDASASTFFGGSRQVDDGNTDPVFGAQYTSGVTLYDAWVIGSFVISRDGAAFDPNATAYWYERLDNGSRNNLDTLASGTQGGSFSSSTFYYTADILGRGLWSDVGTEYGVYQDNNGSNGGIDHISYLSVVWG